MKCPKIKYENTWKKEVVEFETYKEIQYVIVNRGQFPCAYIENIIYAKQGDSILDTIPVHGGVTFCDLIVNWDAPAGVYLGWDYGHLEDYMGCYGAPENRRFKTLRKNKKWTYKEIMKDVRRAIDRLVEIKMEDR